MVESVYRIHNLKVNRIQTGQGEGERTKYIPVTKGLQDLLNELGYEQKKNSDGYIIERPDTMDMVYMMNLMSRSFAHFIKQVTKRDITF